jgi:hypothetical protein
MDFRAEWKATLFGLTLYHKLNRCDGPLQTSFEQNKQICHRNGKLVSRGSPSLCSNASSLLVLLCAPQEEDTRLARRGHSIGRLSNPESKHVSSHKRNHYHMVVWKVWHVKSNLVLALVLDARRKIVNVIAKLAVYFWHVSSGTGQIALSI